MAGFYGLRWRNPFSGQDSYVSFANARFIVFWSKNPAPLLPYLPAWMPLLLCQYVFCFGIYKL